MIRTLVFGVDSDSWANSVRDELRGVGEHAVLRNPQYFDAATIEVDEVRAVVTEHDEIADAYGRLDPNKFRIEVRRRQVYTAADAKAQLEEVEADEATEEVAAPVKARRTRG